MRWMIAIAAALLAPATGCTLDVADPAEAGEGPDAAVTRGNVAVERVITVSSPSPELPLRAHVSARFMQLSGGFDQLLAERVVGTPRELPPTGTCEWREPAGLEPLPPNAAQGSIELLDVGDVMLRAGQSLMPLAARAFPDVGEVVSGVVYTSRDGTADLPAGVPYLIETSGSPLVGGFRLSVDAPPEPLELQLGGILLDSEEVVVLRGDTMELSWRGAEDAANDQIVVDLTPLGSDTLSAASEAVRCAFDDTGSGRVPPEYTSWRVLPDELDVTVHRLRRIVTRLPEIDETIVEFDFAVTTRAPVADAL
jgi:hypothetical protein